MVLEASNYITSIDKTSQTDRSRRSGEYKGGQIDYRTLTSGQPHIDSTLLKQSTSGADAGFICKGPTDNALVFVAWNGSPSACTLSDWDYWIP